MLHNEEKVKLDWQRDLLIQNCLNYPSCEICPHRIVGKYGCEIDELTDRLKGLNEKGDICDMELGNLLWGHARGEYRIDRTQFQDLFAKAFEDMGFDGYGYHQLTTKHDDGDEYFENDTFVVRPYYWGEDDELLCNYSISIPDKEAYDDYLKEHDHPLEYFLPINKDRAINYFTNGIYNVYILYHNEDFRLVKSVDDIINHSKKRKDGYYGIDKIEYVKKEEYVPISERLNFLYKPTGLEIGWYKYPLRDSYSNMPLMMKDAKEMLNACRESMSH